MKKQLFLFMLFISNLLLSADNKTERLKQELIELVNTYQPSGEKTIQGVKNIVQYPIPQTSTYVATFNHHDSTGDLIDRTHLAVRENKFERTAFLFRPTRPSNKKFLKDEDAASALTLLKFLHNEQQKQESTAQE